MTTPQPQAPTAPTLAASKNTNINVVSCASVQGNRGPQWDVSADVPSLSQYPTHFYLNQDEYPEGIQLGQYQVIINRGNLRRGKDGTHDYDYYWNIQDWAADPAQATPAQTQQPQAPAAPRPAPQPAGGTAPQPTGPILPTQQDATRNSIERQVVFKAAVDLAIGTDIVDKDADDICALVERFANDLWGTLQNIGSARPDAPQSNAGPNSNEIRATPQDEEPPAPW